MDIPDKRKLLALGLVLVGVAIFTFSPRIENIALRELKEGKLIVYQGNSVKASVIPVWFKPQIYGSLIDCLAFYESSNNPEAFNPNDPNGGSYGLLQFQRPTFDMYSKKYNLHLDYKNPEDQKLLADYMIQDNWDNIRHWTTRKFCL